MEQRLAKIHAVALVVLLVVAMEAALTASVAPCLGVQAARASDAAAWAAIPVGTQAIAAAAVAELMGS